MEFESSKKFQTSVGLSRGRRGNPAASLRVEKMYGVPVLLSGTASLVLKQVEYDSIDMHYKNKIQNLQKLYDKTPGCGRRYFAVNNLMWTNQDFDESFETVRIYLAIRCRMFPGRRVIIEKRVNCFI